MTRSSVLRLRSALKAGIAGTLAVPAAAHAQQTYRWRMTTTWPAGRPFYQVGPGSAQAFAKR